MTLLPPEPVVPDEHRGRRLFVPRYDDIGQTGHLLLHALPIALGQTAWPVFTRFLSKDAFEKTRVLPILSRFAIETGAAPFSANDSMDSEATIQFAHTVGTNGNVERLVLNMWCSVFGKAGRTHTFFVPNAGERLFAGRVFAEHVLTRPFDPPESRRVTELELPGFPPVPETRHEWLAPEGLLKLPEGASWLEESFAFDAAPVVFGTDRTDSNMHVNSLVYPRLFTDAVLRRLWDLGERKALRAEAMEISFRKPSFAGERTHMTLRAFVSGDKLGAAVSLVGDEERNSPIEMTKPRVFARIWFVPES